jgi:hypothetical protein
MSSVRVVRGLTATAKDATVLGSFLASPASEGRQMTQWWIKNYKNPKNTPLKKSIVGRYFIGHILLKIDVRQCTILYTLYTMSLYSLESILLRRK